MEAEATRQEDEEIAMASALVDEFEAAERGAKER
eukprot:SAG11_NODE_37345_length_257_cov_0.879747_1_plen_34_part_00